MNSPFNTEMRVACKAGARTVRYIIHTHITEIHFNKWTNVRQIDISKKKILHNNIKQILALKRKLWLEENYRLQSDVLKNDPIFGHAWQIKRGTAVVTGTFNCTAPPHNIIRHTQ